MSSLPSNVHVSRHPCLVAKLSQLRSTSSGPKEVGALLHQIGLIISCDALASNVSAVDGPKDTTPLGFEYTTTTVVPRSMCIVPILRSGLSLVQAVQDILPRAVPVHHLGLYRDDASRAPVEYYNNLPGADISPASSLAIVVDPIIATGGTCVAAIQALREWGAKKIVVIAVLGAVDGVRTAAEEWPEGCEVWIAGLDDRLTSSGMLQPGLGDVGDRLFLTAGK
ncbi:uracil phosphoribosyltransferase [Ophiocordyceps camponoti-floridani]|uniref:uracil phosphoribosyltransferase n=1 Tax=Ophiocordyceps camponoti-floridani TaxID=2030778 RepID=A0A8H4Q2J9_9HYPO|nr:uracil phosphoribosyltransferase [Ophiocordyceps camponoti-floridani]